METIYNVVSSLVFLIFFLMWSSENTINTIIKFVFITLSLWGMFNASGLFSEMGSFNG